MSNDEDYLFKIVLLGDSSVGKSAIITRYFKNEFFINSKSTVGVELHSKNIVYKDKKIKAQIWDTSGQERYKAITSSYFKGAKGAIIVYDITKRETLKNAEEWHHLLKQSNSETMIVMLVGNKEDKELERAVTVEEGQCVAKKLGISFIETSAKEKTNVIEAFTQIIHTISESVLTEMTIKDQGSKFNDGLYINEGNSKDKKKCC